MSLPDVTINVQDGALGVAPAVPTNSQVKIGVSSGGTPNTLYSFTDTTTLQSTLGSGDLVEAAAHTLVVAGGPVYCMPINPSQFGYAGSVTHVGTGAATLAVSLAPASSILVTITTAGALGTMKFTYQVGSGAVSQPVTSTGPGTMAFLVPGTMCTLSFAAGTYVLSSTYTVATDGTITRAGSAINTVTQQSSAIDNYQVVATIVVAGALGTAAFKYSVDHGNTQSAQITIPGSGIYAIPGTGIVLTFSGTSVAGDTYSFDTVTAGFTTTDVTNAFTALLALQTGWFMAHVVGTPASASAAASLATTVDTVMATAFTNFRFAFTLIECPTVGTVIVSSTSAIEDTADTDSVVAAAFASFVSTRTAVGAGDCDLVSPVTGRIVRRNAAWPVAARLSLIPPAESAAKFARGALTGVRALYRDEQATPLLDAARFCTLRTFVGVPGFYVTSSKTMALVTSDFAYIEHRRVMDVACTVARGALLKYLNDNVRVNPATGFILEQAAVAIEKDINSQLKNTVVNTTPANASASSVTLKRDQDILATDTEPVTVRIVPLGYMRHISVDIGFSNPAQA